MSYSSFENEEALPRLPVPALASTVQQLLSALKPLLSQEEFLDLMSESSEFLTNETINLIQSHLVAASEDPTQHCYLSTVNDETAPAIYGELRGDILPRNPYLILEEDPYAKTLSPPNQAERTANLINSSLKFIISLRNETLKPDVTPNNNTPLSMSCYRKLFGTTRVPTFARDLNHHNVGSKKYKDINDSRHIVIICNNQFHSLEVITPFSQEEYEETDSKHQIWFNDNELSKILQSIIDSSSNVDQIESVNNSIGAVTTQTLKYWRKARAELSKFNPENMELVDNALFVVVLDTINSPVTDQEKTQVISHGTSVLSSSNVQIGSCTSRWYDKLQLIVTKNSVAGIVWESFSMDSTAILRFISDIYTDSVLKLAKNINAQEYTLFDRRVKFVSADGKISKPEVKRLIFEKTPYLLNLIHLSETRLADLINQHEYKTLNIKLDAHLVKKFQMSIDSILQIAFQIANYSLYGKMVNTLEPITTRKFRDSRTELIPIQNESISNLVKLFISNASPSDKWEQFKKCCDAHTKQYHDAMVGKGFERHFMSLVQVIKRPSAVEYLNKLNKHLEPLPDFSSNNVEIPLLNNNVIEKIIVPELLISNCGNPALSLFGIPPASDRGFGVGYIIHSDRVIITICSKFRQTERFLDTLHRVINDLKNMLKHRSNILLSINDSESRKLELQKLRIERELKHIELDLPSKRHPIELTIDKDYEPIPYESVKIDSEDMKKESSESDGNEDFELLGGYGYFDYGDLDTRSDELSRNESFMNSHSNVGSTLTSRHHSHTNLQKLSVLAAATDIKEKQSLTERIRDKLSKSDDTLPSIVVDSDKDDDNIEQDDFNIDATFDGIDQARKANVGRQLDVSRFT
ncbi:carnitine acetyltransferase [Scheffersomyces amazonensis]|uniref:carnitine acetyltransferase n=1 Tax=Scheffersomyces amazonensis TaxID=1078765 RepID=UPI00315D9830